MISIRLLLFTSIALCVLTHADYSNATPPRQIQCLNERYYLLKAIDVSFIDSNGDFVSQNDSRKVVSIETILDYFCRLDRVTPLSRWQADSHIVNAGDSILHNKYKFWVHDQVELPGDPSWSENPLGDRNWVYHLHSFDFLWILSEAYRSNGNISYLKKGLELVMDYIDDNCTPSKLTSPLAWFDHSVANRMIFLTDCWPLLVENGLMTRDVASKLLEFSWRHGRFLYDKNNYFSWSNHGIFSSLALFRLATFFPEFTDSSLWRTTAINRMEIQLTDNFSTDGIHKEFSPWYQIWSAAVISKYMEDCQISGVTLPSKLLDKYEKITRVSPCFIHPDNTISLAGDSGLEPNEKLMSKFLAETLSEPHERTVSSMETGVFVMRSGRNRSSAPENESCLMAFFTDKANDHDHIDPLNLELYSRGQKWITDSGRYAYEPNRPQRKYVLSQRAHNTIVPSMMQDDFDRIQQSRRQNFATEKIKNTDQLAEVLSDESLTDIKKLKSRFITENKDLLSSIDKSTSNNDKTLERLFEKIESIENINLKIEVLKHIEKKSAGIIREKIILMIALSHMKRNDIPAMKRYLGKIIEMKSSTEYYDLANQLLATTGLENGKKFDESNLSPSIEKGQKRENLKSTQIHLPTDGKSDEGEVPIRTDDYRQIPLKDTDETDILTWISKKRFDYLEGTIDYDNTFSHSRAILFVKPHYFVIVDRIEVKRQRIKTEQIFHFPPEVNVEDLGNGKYRLNSNDSLYCLMVPLLSFDDMDTELVKGQTKPYYQGWYSGHYRKMIPASAMINHSVNQPGIHYVAYLLAPTGTRNTTRTRIRSTHPDAWDGSEDKPLHVWINDPAFITSFSFIPSQSYIQGNKSVLGPPKISVRQFRN